MFSIVTFPLGILIHTLLIFGHTFFLSPEISLYPYFLSRGLVPYRQLVDQHFPLLFFGPVNLSQIGFTTSESALLIFLILIFLTDFFVYSILKKQPIAFFVFIFCQYLLGGNNLWIESFVTLSLAAYLFFKSNSKTEILAGLVLSFALGLRPILLPFVILLVILTHRRKILTLLLLPVIPLLEIFWLLTNNLWNEFISITLFNSTVYSRLAFQLPDRVDLIIILIVATPLLILSVDTKRIYSTLALVVLILPLGYPRFDLSDLLPITALIIFLNRGLTRQGRHLMFYWFIATFIFIVLRRWDFKPTNFYYPKSLYQEAAYLSKNYDLGSSIYLFGGPDQLYQLTNTTPPGNYYLPSLPWYLTEKTYRDRQLSALQSHPGDLVVVNLDSHLDGVSLLDYGKPIWDYIQTNYQKIDSVNNLTIYAHRN